MVNVSKLTKKRLGELLREEEVVDEEQIQEALERQEDTGEMLGRSLVELGHVTQEDIARVICRQFGLPYVEVNNYAPRTSLVEQIPNSLLERYCFLPLDQIGDVVVVAVPVPFDENFFHQLAELFGEEIQIVISTRRNIETQLVSEFGLNPGEFNLDQDVEDLDEIMEDSDFSLDELEKEVETAADTTQEPEPTATPAGDDSEPSKVFSLEESEDGTTTLVDLKDESGNEGNAEAEDADEPGDDRESTDEQKAEIP